MIGYEVMTKAWANVEKLFRGQYPKMPISQRTVNIIERQFHEIL